MKKEAYSVLIIGTVLGLMAACHICPEPIPHELQVRSVGIRQAMAMGVMLAVCLGLVSGEAFAYLANRTWGYFVSCMVLLLGIITGAVCALCLEVVFFSTTSWWADASFSLAFILVIVPIFSYLDTKEEERRKEVEVEGVEAARTLF